MAWFRREREDPWPDVPRRCVRVVAYEEHLYGGHRASQALVRAELRQRDLFGDPASLVWLPWVVQTDGDDDVRVLLVRAFRPFPDATSRFSIISEETVPVDQVETTVAGVQADAEARTIASADKAREHSAMHRAYADATTANNQARQAALRLREDRLTALRREAERGPLGAIDGPDSNAETRGADLSPAVQMPGRESHDRVPPDVLERFDLGFFARYEQLVTAEGRWRALIGHDGAPVYFPWPAVPPRRRLNPELDDDKLDVLLVRAGPVDHNRKRPWERFTLEERHSTDTVDVPVLFATLSEEAENRTREAVDDALEDLTTDAAIRGGDIDPAALSAKRRQRRDDLVEQITARLQSGPT